MNHCDKGEIYDKVIGEMLGESPYRKAKLSSMTKRELKGLEDAARIVKGAAGELDDQHEAIIRNTTALQDSIKVLTAAYRNTGITPDLENLKAALTTGIQALEKALINERKKGKFVADVQRRLDLVDHSLELQTIHVKEHQLIADVHFQILDANLGILNGDFFSGDHQVRQAVARRLHTQARHINTGIQVGIAVALAWISFKLFVW